jgi:hypothetical protein
MVWTCRRGAGKGMRVPQVTGQMETPMETANR